MTAPSLKTVVANSCQAHDCKSSSQHERHGGTGYLCPTCVPIIRPCLAFCSSTELICHLFLQIERSVWALRTSDLSLSYTCQEQLTLPSVCSQARRKHAKGALHKHLRF